jgi:hypothetical protein
MLFHNPLMAQQMAKESMKETLREATQARLIRTASGQRKTLEWKPPVTFILSSLSVLFTRLQIRQSS